jgi:cytochrome c oxidase cbb3-type subunit 3
MSTDPTGRLLDHEYDGIQEFDNPLPSWWRWLFAVSIVFSVGYWMWYHIGNGATIEETYQTRVARYWESQLSRLGLGEPTDEAIVELSRNESMMEAMAGAFENNCAQCHRADLGGNIGPNLTDDHWKNVKSPVDIVRVISDGVPGTAMTAWKNRFREPQIMLIAAYVASRRGSGPPNPKAAEGVVIEAWDRWSDEATGSTDVGSGS